MTVDHTLDTTAEAARLDSHWGRPGAVRLERSPLGGVVAVLRAAGGEAVVAVQGGQVLSYRPAGTRDVIWLSTGARLDTGNAVRGGVPVCWPWFGRHATSPDMPAHGFARTAPWRVVASGASAGAATISLAFETRDEHRLLWPHSAHVRLDVSLSHVLRLGLVTENPGIAPISITQALHTYFAISDVSSVSLEGLDGRAYDDHAGPLTRRRQAGPIAIDREVNRVYDESEDDVVIHDRLWQRRIIVAKEGSRATVVWNPWIERSVQLGDMGPEGYRRMVCVETANAGRDIVVLAPGATARLAQIISVEPIE